MDTNLRKKMPVYFISHGGPEFMYMKDFDGYKVVQQLGKEITENKQLKGVLVISAHWTADNDNTIYVNTAEHTDLIYDFSNRPQYMYNEKFPNTGSTQLANRVIELLTSNGVKCIGTTHGLDHGVWVPFKIAFSPETNPLNVPIVQMSLYQNNDPVKHIDLGRYLAPLRDENICIITSGMSVHNLNERYDYPEGSVASYTQPFDQALSQAIISQVGDLRQTALIDLLKRDDTFLAHPTLEHLLPIYVATGAAYNESAQLVYTYWSGSFAWAQYRYR